jgi:hypothetical protein
MPHSAPWTVAAFALATAAATLAVAWPTSTHADDSAGPIATYAVDGWKIGDVVAKGQLQPDAHSKSGWVIVVTARNGAGHDEVVPLETDVTRLSASPMARVMPVPQVVWSTRESVRVPARGTISLRYELPRELAASVATAQTARKPAGPAAMMTPVISFGVAFDRERARAAQPQPSLPPAVAN